MHFNWSGGVITHNEPRNRLGTTEFCSFFWGKMINNKSIITYNNLEDLSNGARDGGTAPNCQMWFVSTLIPLVGRSGAGMALGDRNV